jgi:hypothetical protein
MCEILCGFEGMRKISKILIDKMGISKRRTEPTSFFFEILSYGSYNIYD